MSTVKRLLVGRPVDSENLGETLLPKRIALPVFASDPLSAQQRTAVRVAGAAARAVPEEEFAVRR